MRYMMIVKHREEQGVPPKELMQAIEKLSEEANKAMEKELEEIDR